MTEVLWLALWWLLLKGREAMSSNVTPAEKLQVLNALAAAGWPSKEVDAVIAFESGWSTVARNRVSNAVGLIQFMPSTLQRLGFEPNAPTSLVRVGLMQGLTAAQQLPWILKYFAGTGKKWKVPGDTYLAVAAPAYIGASDTTVIYPVGSRAWDQNPAWRDGATGPITAGSIRRIITRRLP